MRCDTMRSFADCDLCEQKNKNKNANMTISRSKRGKQIERKM